MLKRHLLSILLCSAVGAYAQDGDSSQSDMATNPPSENNFYVETDFLYWFAKQEGNTYAATGAGITVPGTVDPNTGLTPAAITESGKVYSPNPTWKPGFKVALGAVIRNDWDLNAEYTWLYSSAKSNVTSGDLNTSILPLYSYTPHNSVLSQTIYAAPSSGTTYVGSANANWSLHFNNVNLDLRRNVKLLDGFMVYPHLGAQGSWQTQKFVANYIVNSTTNAATVLGNNQVVSTQSFWGVGPRVGLDSSWQCCDHFGLFADSALAALWSQFTSHGKSYDTNISGDYSNVLIADQVYQPSTLTPVAQLQVGVQSDWTFCDQYKLLLQAGWEGQVWFFSNQHSTSIADTSLILQGLTVTARFDF